MTLNTAPIMNSGFQGVPAMVDTGNSVSMAAGGSGFPVLEILILAGIVCALGINVYLTTIVLKFVGGSKQISQGRVQQALSQSESQQILDAIKDIRLYLETIERRLVQSSSAENTPRPSRPAVVATQSGASANTDHGNGSRATTAGMAQTTGQAALDPEAIIQRHRQKIITMNAQGYSSAEMQRMVESGEVEFFFRPPKGNLRLLQHNEHVRDMETFCGFRDGDSNVFLLAFGRGLQQFKADIQRSPYAWMEKIEHIFDIDNSSGTDFGVRKPAIVSVDGNVVTVLHKGRAVL